MPARRAVYADVDGNLGAQDAALVPRRQGGRWEGWLTLDDLPHLVNPRSGSIAAEGPPRSGYRGTSVVFSHALAVTSAARRRFSIGPLDPPAADDSPVRALFDLLDWDHSIALNAPGQSEAADSPRFADSAALWSRGEMAPLVFSPAAVEANAETTLVVRPPQRTR
jgi:acyl-homoserine lactone acylase PvdQ